jgi:hypothetical protein
MLSGITMCEGEKMGFESYCDLSSDMVAGSQHRQQLPGPSHTLYTTNLAELV